MYVVLTGMVHEDIGEKRVDDLRVKRIVNGKNVCFRETAIAPRHENADLRRGACYYLQCTRAVGIAPDR